MSKFTSRPNAGSTSTYSQNSESTEGLMGNKLSRVPELVGKKKQEWFYDEARVNKYWALKQQYPTLPDKQLRISASNLSAEEKKAVEKRLDDDILKVQAALKDVRAFKKYFFDDITPIIQENTFALLQKGVFDPEERARELQKTREAWKATPELTFKLLLSSLADATSGSVANWLYRKVANLTTEFGLNHSALQIGPYLFDWNTSEVIIPRNFKSKNAVLLIPINDNVVLPKNEQNLLKISQIVVEWNTNWEYSRDSKPDKKISNCQYFVEYVLDYLSMATSWAKNGPITKYIKKLKENTASPESLKIWDEIGEHEFRNHKELTEYYETIVRTNRDERTRKELELILKSIERCMMFRYWATKNEKLKVVKPIFNPNFKTPQSGHKSSGSSENLLCQSKLDDGPEYDDEDEDQDDYQYATQEVTGMLTMQ